MQKTVYVGCNELSNSRGRKIIGLVRKLGVRVRYDPRSKGIRAYPNQPNRWTVKPVHLTGSKRDVHMAIVLIRNAVGKEQFSEEIDKPPNKVAVKIGAGWRKANRDIGKEVRKSAVARRAASISQCTKKVIYVKSFAADNRLNGSQGKKMKEIMTKSGVDDIQIEYKPDQPTVVVEMKDSNGDVFVPVYLIGNEEALQNAVVLIQEAVGMENMDEEINLPRETWSLLVLRTMAIQIRNLWEQLRFFPMLMLGSITGMLRKPFALYQAKRIQQTIYISSSKSKIFTGKQGKKKKGWIITKSGIEDLQIDVSTNSDTYVAVHLTGSRCAAREAVVLVRETIGIEHVEEEYVITDQPLRSPPTQTTTSSTAVIIDASLSSKPQSNHEDNVTEDRGTAQSTPDDASSDTPDTQEQNNAGSVSNTVTDTQVQQNPIQEPSQVVDSSVDGGDERRASESENPDTPEQHETINNDNNQTEEVTGVESSTPVVALEEGVPSEIGVSSSLCMTTRETITEASVSSFNGSNVSKTQSEFTLNENDPLLIFLRSQQSCIKGSVDEFYTWLIKSEDVDSMLALKEAVCENDYLYGKIKNGDGRSGLKGFKLPAFKRSVLEYEDTEPLVEDAHSASLSVTDVLLTDPPAELLCPISLVLMINDPVVAADGITYERASIEDWFEKSKTKISEAQENLKHNPHSVVDRRVIKNGICSPVYGIKMENLALVSITGTRNMARAYKEKANTIN